MRRLPIPAYLPTIRGLAANTLLRKPVYPFYASFKITSHCHFGCPFCNVWKNRGPDLSTDAIKLILDNLSRSSVLMTSFEGGEPLLREDIGELLRYARTCKFYLLFTTSVRNPQDYPLQEYAKYIDYFHVSIDEGHNNLELFDRLPWLATLPTQVSVQTVVTAQTLPALEDKVRRCHDVGANIVVIPATVMDDAQDCFPDMAALEQSLMKIRANYPDTMHTPAGYFAAFRRGACSTDSVVIAPDGRLYYPCHILGTKGPDLQTVDLQRWLATPEARVMRAEMRACERNCGWYQYYAISAYLSPASVFAALRPMLTQTRRRQPK
jgi:MoaA/NifB/PqqE/SkfB family radical SAM enzyme